MKSWESLQNTKLSLVLANVEIGKSHWLMLNCLRILLWTRPSPPNKQRKERISAINMTFSIWSALQQKLSLDWACKSVNIQVNVRLIPRKPKGQLTFHEREQSSKDCMRGWACSIFEAASSRLPLGMGWEMDASWVISLLGSWGGG